MMPMALPGVERNTSETLFLIHRPSCQSDHREDLLLSVEVTKQAAGIQRSKFCVLPTAAAATQHITFACLLALVPLSVLSAC
jgi:hypothetical protein